MTNNYNFFFYESNLPPGTLIDLETRRSKRVRAHFHLVGQWWHTTILRTKTSKDKFREPKDIHALCYRLREDERVYEDKVVHLFLSKVAEMYGHPDTFVESRGKFEDYLR